MVKPADMTLRIQAADLLAWAANRRYAAEGEWTSTWRYLLAMSVLVMPRYHSLYGEAELRNHPGFFGWPDGPTARTEPPMV
jgi:hypothetical protein